MLKQRAPPAEPRPQREDRLAHIPGPLFVAAWETLVGEPPATMLDNRSEMIRLLVDCTPVMTPAGQAAWGPASAPACEVGPRVRRRSRLRVIRAGRRKPQ